MITRATFIVLREDQKFYVQFIADGKDRWICYVRIGTNGQSSSHGCMAVKKPSCKQAEKMVKRYLTNSAKTV